LSESWLVSNCVGQGQGVDTHWCAMCLWLVSCICEVHALRTIAFMCWLRAPASTYICERPHPEWICSQLESYSHQARDTIMNTESDESIASPFCPFWYRHRIQSLSQCLNCTVRSFSALWPRLLVLGLKSLG